MFRRSALCLFAILVTAALMPGDAAAQYGSGWGGGYYRGGGGYHSGEAPRRERRSGQKQGGQQCYTKRTKVRDGQGGYRWESQKVCD